MLSDASIQTLTAQHADFDFHHVEPARVFGRVMKLQTPEDAMPRARGRFHIWFPDCELANTMPGSCWFVALCIVAALRLTTLAVRSMVWPAAMSMVMLPPVTDPLPLDLTSSVKT